MSKFTREEINQLYDLFEPHEHEVREGSTKNKVMWFTYIKRRAITMRLESVFPGEWEPRLISKEKHNGYFTATYRITIRGISREYNGGASGDSEDAEKAAVTDAFKRCASMWGIGLYLQDSPQIWTEGGYHDQKGHVIDWNKKRAQEQEALGKVARWLQSLKGEETTDPDTGEITRKAPQNENSAPPGVNTPGPSQNSGTGRVARSEGNLEQKNNGSDPVDIALAYATNPDTVPIVRSHFGDNEKTNRDEVQKFFNWVKENYPDVVGVYAALPYMKNYYQEGAELDDEIPESFHDAMQRHQMDDYFARDETGQPLLITDADSAAVAAINN